MPDLEDDAFKIAKYLYINKHTAGNAIVLSKLREAVALPATDFNPADRHLLSTKYCGGTWGGERGHRWLTTTGVQYVTTKVTQIEGAKKSWSNVVIAIIGFLIAIAAIIISLMIPEVRKRLKLE